MKKSRACSVFAGVRFFVGCLLGVAICASAANAETWQFGSFSIDWANGYVRLPKSDINQYAGPNGVRFTIDVIGHHQLSDQEERQAIQSWLQYAHEQLTALAARHGVIVIPLKEEKLQQDRILMSLAEESEKGPVSNFGLLFLVISPHGEVGQISVEGPGTAAEQMAKFRPLLDTARWNN